MKQFIFLLFFLTVGLSLFGQDYLDLSDGKRWSEIYIKTYNISRYTINYRINGDTLFNGKIYKKLYKTANVDLSNWKLEDFCLLEENGKFYCCFYELGGYTTDELLFDTTLDVGESYLLYGSRKVDIVAKGDTILSNGNGVKRKYVHVTDWIGHITETWVDGIGFLNSGYDISTIGLTGVRRTLLCSHDGEVQLYQNPEFNSCYVYEPQSVTDCLENKSIHVWCIGIGALAFRWETILLCCKIELYKEDGIFVTEASLKKDDKQWQVHGLSQGLYLYKITTSSTNQIIGKIYVK